MEISEIMEIIDDNEIIFPRKWNNLQKVLTKNGPFVQAGFNTEENCIDLLREAMILVVGAGGLGCEMLKDLAMMGFANLHVIDCDTIEISNLNRQFLFRMKDLGRSKAEVAAEFINKRVPGCNVTPHFCKIEEKDSDFYLEFNIIVSGLDAIGPRRWLNSVLFGLLEPSETVKENGNHKMLNIIPMVDGGTEGFKGNVRLVIPSYQNPCIECMLDLFPPQVTYPLCTLTQRPRLPEHCIEYVKLVQWPKEHPFGDQTELDADDPTHLQWIYEKALERANEFGIEGVTYRLTQGVIKNIIPAVASTNATIAAACITEVFKLMTVSAPSLNNYLVYNNSDGIYTYSYSAERKSDCDVCGVLPTIVDLKKDYKLQQFLVFLEEHYNMEPKSSITTTMQDGENQTLYMSFLEEETGPNLDLTFEELGIIDGQIILASDSTTIKKFLIKYVTTNNN